MSGRVFFLGAGASRPDGFPLTRDIIYALAHSIVSTRYRYENLSRFLRTVFYVKQQELKHAASCWSQFVATPASCAADSPTRIPDIMELLSLLDALAADDAVIAAETGSKRKISSRALSRTRDDIGHAIAKAFSELAAEPWRRDAGGITERFVGHVEPTDAIITTNWDLLLDRSLDRRFGTTPQAVGTDAIIVDQLGDPILHPTEKARPPLFKLHGSLNWLACARCTRLYVNPCEYLAHFGFKGKVIGDSNKCHCGIALNAVLVTPTPFKQYKNRHILNIWARAQEALAECSEWHVVGYSLPADDVHIRALLLKALHIKTDNKMAMPRIVVYTKPSGSAELQARYERLLRKVTVDEGGFESLASSLGTSARGRTPHGRAARGEGPI